MHSVDPNLRERVRCLSLSLSSLDIVHVLSEVGLEGENEPLRRCAFQKPARGGRSDGAQLAPPAALDDKWRGSRCPLISHYAGMFVHI